MQYQEQLMQQTSQTTQLVYLLFNKNDLKFTTNQISEEKNIIFLVECTLCQKQNTGESEWPFYFRLNNSRDRIKSRDQNNLILVKQHAVQKVTTLTKTQNSQSQKEILKI